MVKKISHKEVRRRMKMNEMAEATHWLEELWINHGKTITWGLVVIVVLAVAGYLYRDARGKSRNRSATLYQKALQSVSAEMPDEASSLVNQIVKSYPSTPSYPFALLLKGDLLFDQENYEEAIASYNLVIERKKDPDLASTALLAKAICQENLGRLDEAASSYRQILDLYPQSGRETEARFRLASLKENQGAIEKALTLYKTIPQDSIWVNEATQRIEWLEAPVFAIGSIPDASPSDELISSSSPS